MAVPFNPPIRPAGVHPKRPRRALRHLATQAVAAVIAGLPGCDGLEEHVVIGIINFDDPIWPLPEIPETAIAGVPVEMTIWTGESGCYEQGYTEVEVSGRSAVVTPYDLLTIGTGCFTYLDFFEHEATVVFEEPELRKSCLCTARTDGMRPRITRGMGGRCTRWRWWRRVTDLAVPTGSSIHTPCKLHMTLWKSQFPLVASHLSRRIRPALPSPTLSRRLNGAHHFVGGVAGPSRDPVALFSPTHHNSTTSPIRRPEDYTGDGRELYRVEVAER